ncbi:MAG: hypothetical protein WAN75_44665, partial [Xanthobacteraceae bacterium]
LHSAKAFAKPLQSAPTSASNSQGRKTREATDFRGCDKVVEIGMGYCQTQAILSLEPLGPDTAFTRLHSDTTE